MAIYDGNDTYIIDECQHCHKSLNANDCNYYIHKEGYKLREPVILCEDCSFIAPSTLFKVTGFYTG
jgi:hypothetical protein